MHSVVRTISAALLAVFLLSSIASAAGYLDPKLEDKMRSGGIDLYSVVVTFKHQNDVLSLSSLGVGFEALNVLPMVGALMTADQIATVLNWETVESIYLNDRITFFNYTSGEITGGHYVHDNYGVKGKGVTVFVLDTGVDATHIDLPWRTKVKENVRAITEAGLAGGFAAYIEGVQKTDNYSGHGTHVAGTVAGIGEASKDDLRRRRYHAGIAPEASLVGYSMLGADYAAGSALLDALKGLDYAIANQNRFGVNIITNSWGTTTTGFDPNNPINQATYEAYRRGMVVAFAAGNEGPNDNTMSIYASVPWVVSVAAGDKNKALASFSSRGVEGDPWLHPDISAPGVGVISTRAPGTVTGSITNYVDVSYPLYTNYYQSLSGTSMATPFTAGTAALLLSANPQLSPDQVEEIIVSTADPMPGQPLHRVGSGYINVRKAVELARTTQGKRQQFLAGDTKWSSSGNWTSFEQSDARLTYNGSWSTVATTSASGGSYKSATVKGKNSGQAVIMRLYGRSIKFEYPTNSKGGSAEVVIDGVSKGIINFNSTNPAWGVRSAFGGLSSGDHVIQIRAIQGSVYLDKIYVDGRLFEAAVQLADRVESFSGSVGPSSSDAGVEEIDYFPFELSDHTVAISARLSFEPAGDIDFYLLDPDGNVLGSGATLSNPEELTAYPTKAGTYQYKVVGFATATANYTITSTVTEYTSTGTSKQMIGNQEAEVVNNTRPKALTLHQNYPNPFNPSTIINYEIPQDGLVKLQVYNLLGQLVAEPVNGEQRAGSHALRFNASALPAGMYFYRLTSGALTDVKRMLLVK